MIKIISATICLAVIVGCLRVIINEIKKTGNPKIMKGVERIKTAFIKTGSGIIGEGATTIIERGKEILKEMNIIPPEIVNQIVDEGAEHLISLVFPAFRSSSSQAGRIFTDNFSESGKYAYVITEDEDHPFQITALIASTTEKIIAGKTTAREKAEAVFDWFERNVKYDDKGKRPIKNNKKVGYRHSSETFKDRKGVCGEMAILYVVMARHAGLKTNYASVRKDCHNKLVNHACASVKVGGRDIHADPAYHLFDAHHRKINILSDVEAIKHFKSFRG